MADTEWTAEHLISHVTHAVSLELFTIPAYLSAYYSINQSGSNAAKAAADAILTVLNEEMMHLQLACNLSNALGQGPRLTGESAPSYPGVLKFSLNRIEIALGPATDAQIERFMEIELPARNDPYNREDPPPAVDYDTIGEFYQALIHGLKAVYGPGCEPVHDGAASGPKPRDPSEPWPTTTSPQVYGTFGDDAFPIIDLDSAIRALDLIVLQGEGASPADPTTDSPGEQAHYYQFQSIVKSLQPGDLRPTIVNKAGLPYSTRCARLLDFFDACYSDLLRQLEACFNGLAPIQPTLRLMFMVIDPLAHYLAGTAYAAKDHGPPTGHTLTPRFQYTAASPEEAYRALDAADRGSEAVQKVAAALKIEAA
jgi:Ferritin-like